MASLIDLHWSDTLGVAPDAFSTSGIHVVPHRKLHGFPGAAVVRVNRAMVLSVPRDLVSSLSREVAHLDAQEDLFSDEVLDSLFGDLQPAVSAATAHLFVMAETFVPHQNECARLLTVDDRPKLLEFARACDEGEWEDVSIGLEQGVRWGALQGEKLVAVADLTPLDHCSARIAVLVRPDHRGAGYGKCVASGAVEYALDEGLLVHWPTGLTNKPSLATAKALGFIDYASQITVRFRAMELPWTVNN
jgi:GNAT superfamily N-acetyltransferase